MSCSNSSLSTLEYCSVWWRLFNSLSASEWSNALALVQLLLSLPASNGDNGVGQSSMVDSRHICCTTTGLSVH